MKKKMEYSLLLILAVLLVVIAVFTTATRAPAEPEQKPVVKQATFQGNVVLKHLVGPEKAKLLDEL